MSEVESELLNQQPIMVELEHPHLKRKIEVRPQAVGAYEESGWVVVKKAAKAAAEEEKKK